MATVMADKVAAHPTYRALQAKRNRFGWKVANLMMAV